ncbi:MAG: DUF4430 domain-containing protein [Candidatus Odinarchaeia archaeon]
MSLETNKSWIISVILLVSTMGLASSTAFFYTQYTYYHNFYDQVTTNNIIVNIGINYGNGTVEWFNNTVVPKEFTAFNLTTIVANVEYTVYSFGIYVESINGVEGGWSDGTHTFYWIWYLNGEQASVGCDAYQLVYGDTIEWRYESF